MCNGRARARPEMFDRAAIGLTIFVLVSFACAHPPSDVGTSAVLSGAAPTPPPAVNAEHVSSPAEEKTPADRGDAGAPLESARAVPPPPPTYPDGTWSLADLRKRSDLRAGDTVRLTAWVVERALCPPCPPHAVCAPCAPPSVTVNDSAPHQRPVNPSGIPDSHENDTGAAIFLPSYGDPKLALRKRYVFECTLKERAGGFFDFTYVSHEEVTDKNRKSPRPGCPNWQRKSNGECCPPGTVAHGSNCPDF
jgi:hypothetical protein